jgi:hypothetical protein
MTDKINDFVDLENAAEQFQDAVVPACTENCPLTVSKSNRNIPGGPKTLRRGGGRSADYSMLLRMEGSELTTKEF